MGRNRHKHKKVEKHKKRKVVIILTQDKVDAIVAEAKNLADLEAAFVAAAQDAANNPPVAGTPATHDDVVALQTKLDSLISAVQALNQVPVPAPAV